MDIGDEIEKHLGRKMKKGEFIIFLGYDREAALKTADRIRKEEDKIRQDLGGNKYMAQKEVTPKERYKSYRAYPIIIKFPVEIDDEEYDKLRTYLFEIFPVSMVEQLTPKIVSAIVPEGMVTAAKDVKKFFTDNDIIVDIDNYNVYIERK
jgi:hypothetical protein